MPTIQEQIDVLQGQIDGIKGNVDGVAPAPCNITTLNTTVAELEAQIKTLKASKVEEDNPFLGTTMSLRFGNGNIPSLVVRAAFEKCSA